jgi:hypothetical protein
MRRVVAFVMGVLVACTGSVFAQDAGSRAEEQARQQQEKARSLSPYTPGFFERRILQMEDTGGFNRRRGPFVAFGDIKRGSGFALGPGYGKVLASGTTVLGKAIYSINNYKLLHFSAKSAPLFGDRVVVSGRVRWQDAPTVRLYALGSDSPDVRTAYAETKTELGGEALFKPVRLLRFGSGLGLEQYTTERAHSADPLEPLLRVPGMGADPTYVHSRVSAAIDSRDGESYTTTAIRTAARLPFSGSTAMPSNTCRFCTATG